jgi:DNA polymerase-3 subunit gamma/tau
MMAQLAKIGAAEGLDLESRALSLIAKVSEGSVRDALSVVDQVVAASGATVREADVVAVLGVVDRQGFSALTRAICDKDAAGALTAARALFDHGHDVKLLCAELVEYVRHLTVLTLGGKAAETLDLPQEEVEELRAAAASFELDDLVRLFSVFSQAQEDIRFAMYPPFTLEMALVKATRVVALEPIERLIARVETLGSGIVPSPPSPRAPQPTRSEPAAVAPLAKQKATEPAPKVVEQSVPEPISGPMLDAEHLWRLIMQRVADEKPNLESYLRSGRPVAGERDEFTVEYTQQDAWAADLASRADNQAYVGRVLSEVAGREVTFRIRRTASAPGERGAGRRAAAESAKGASSSSGTPSGQGPTSRQAAVSEVMANPMVKDALTVFGGEVMEVRDLGTDGDRRNDDG